MNNFSGENNQNLTLQPNGRGTADGFHFLPELRAENSALSIGTSLPVGGAGAGSRAGPSRVEAEALKRSPYDQLRCGPEERLDAVVVNAFPELGRLVALRFIEWVMQNPNGVVSLPTGRSPEFFIIWTKRIMSGWDQDKEVVMLMRDYVNMDIRGAAKPRMDGLTFVQMDEFYPIDAKAANSFKRYCLEHYVEGFGLDKSKALLMDFADMHGAEVGGDIEAIWPGGRVPSLPNSTKELDQNFTPRQKQALKEVADYCAKFEARIRARGGIGFFLGGIGPDGHVAFNCAEPHVAG